jgi:hypothetical protein
VIKHKRVIEKELILTEKYIIGFDIGKKLSK